ncbi:hypothetical protein XENORESO_012453, partial [Xenotaenia resolanae]
ALQKSGGSLPSSHYSTPLWLHGPPPATWARSRRWHRTYLLHPQKRIRQRQKTQMVTTQRGPLHPMHLLPHLSPTLLLHPLLLHNLPKEESATPGGAI